MTYNKGGEIVLKYITSERLKEALLMRDMKQIELATKTGLGKSAISQYLSGKVNPKQDKIHILAKALSVDELWLMGISDSPAINSHSKLDFFKINNIFQIETKKIPLLGDIACGIPKLADENFECYVEVGSNVKADFCVRATGDSMINARILDGDIVFIHKQSDVEDGDIAAVLIDDECTLKRVFKMPGRIQLRAENPKYDPINLKENDCSNIVILGKAIAFQSDVK